MHHAMACGTKATGCDVKARQFWYSLSVGLAVCLCFVQVQEHIVLYGIVRVRKTHKCLGIFELEVS
jgi:hypothetical protein